jgi:hypothetical protein
MSTRRAASPLKNAEYGRDQPVKAFLNAVAENAGEYVDFCGFSGGG